MKKVIQFNSFKTSYKRLLENKHNIYVVEFYHHDMPSQPTVSIVSLVSDVFAEFNDETYISIRFNGGTDLTFTNESYTTNLSNECVVFSSKHNDETYCIIEFREERGCILEG